MALDLDYIDVAQRIADFRAAYPDGSLQPADTNIPYRIEKIGDQTYISVVAAAYRTPDDTRPGIGMAYEVFPGKTNFTRGSELQNAETSAWGRAIVAALAGDTKKSIASAQEVRNRQAERDEPETPQRPKAVNKPKPASEPKPMDVATMRALIAQAGAKKNMDLAAVGAEFTDWSKGEQITACVDIEELQAFLTHLSKQAAA